MRSVESRCLSAGFESAETEIDGVDGQIRARYLDRKGSPNQKVERESRWRRPSD